MPPGILLTMQYNSEQGTVLVEVFSSTEATYVG
jgi:hypothetical protein